MAVSETTTHVVAAAAKQRPARSSPSSSCSVRSRTLSSPRSSRCACLRRRSSSRTPPSASSPCALLARASSSPPRSLLQLKTVLDNADGTLARSSGRVSLARPLPRHGGRLRVNALLFAALGHVDRRALARARGLRRADADPERGLQPLAGVREVRGGGRCRSARHGLARRASSRCRVPRRVRAAGPVHSRAVGAAFGASSRTSRRRERRPRGSCTTTARLWPCSRTSGLSTQLLVLGACLVAGVPVVYLWFALAGGLLVPCSRSGASVVR